MGHKRFYKTMAANLPERFAKALKEVAEHPRGPGGVLEDGEIARGATIIPWGATEPFDFSKRDWKRGVISLKDGEVRIIAVEARTPRSGALKRLVKSIQDAGLKPVIAAAMFEMPAILTRWGWVKTVENDGDWGKIDLWRPPA